MQLTGMEYLQVTRSDQSARGLPLLMGLVSKSLMGANGRSNNCGRYEYWRSSCLSKSLMGANGRSNPVFATLWRWIDCSPNPSWEPTAVLTVTKDHFLLSYIFSPNPSWEPTAVLTYQFYQQEIWCC